MFGAVSTSTTSHLEQKQNEEQSLAKKMTGVMLFFYENYHKIYFKSMLIEWNLLTEKEKEKFEKEALSYESSVIELKKPKNINKYDIVFCKKCNLESPSSEGTGFGQKTTDSCPKCGSEEIFQEYDREIAQFLLGIFKSGCVGYRLFNDMKEFYYDRQSSFAVVDLDFPSFENLSEEQAKQVTKEFEENEIMFDLAVRFQKIKREVSKEFDNFKQHVKLNLKFKKKLLNSKIYSNFESIGENNIEVDEKLMKIEHGDDYVCHGNINSNLCVSVNDKIISIPFNKQNDILSNFKKKDDHFMISPDKMKMLTNSLNVDSSKKSSILEQIRRQYFTDFEEISGELESLILLKPGNNFNQKMKNNQIGTLLIFLPSFFEGGNFELNTNENEKIEFNFSSNYDNLFPKFIFIKKYDEFKFQTMKSGIQLFLIFNIISNSIPEIKSQNNHITKLFSEVILLQNILDRSEIFATLTNKNKSTEKCVLLNHVYENSYHSFNPIHLKKDDYYIYSLMKNSFNFHLNIVPVSVQMMMKVEVTKKDSKMCYDEIIHPLDSKLVQFKNEIIDYIEGNGTFGNNFVGQYSKVIFSTYAIEFKEKEIYNFNSIKNNDLFFK
eukprot:gene2135-2001_t